ncbi:CHAP domain-containing protein [Sphingobacterium sp. DR205]|uniref:CHAP domain-containing protein n=1 Tax=Sphingobacterium sp. DR205 TaxID=2713573 RepID=UPI001F497472|nr:CHAP domain-containing protein [Sphingobacterium sp. DR205]
MATMHYLFLGVFSVAVLLLGSFGHRPVVEHNAPSSPYEQVAVHYGASELGSSVNFRERIVDIARHEMAVKEATGNNDGPRVEEYLAYTGLGKGHAWCAAFVSWSYGKAGLPAPRNAWSPALFPLVRRYTKEQILGGVVRQADLFAIYNQKLGRIDHVGIVQKMEGNWILTVEGNVNNGVLSKRRSLATIYAFSNWLD